MFEYSYEKIFDETSKTAIPLMQKKIGEDNYFQIGADPKKKRFFWDFTKKF